jgi:hypothetical protein
MSNVHRARVAGDEEVEPFDHGSKIPDTRATDQLKCFTSGARSDLLDQASIRCASSKENRS